MTDSTSEVSAAKAQETKTRVMTGVAGGVVLLGLIIFGGHVGISFVAAVLGGAMCWELAQVFYTMPDKQEKMWAVVGVSWLCIFVNMLIPKSMLECLVFSFMGLFMYYLATTERNPGEMRKHFDEFVFTIFALVYVVTFIGFLPLIRGGLDGVRWTILFLLIVWAGDTGAYFAGRKYGKQKLAPMISPGKSVEGAIGGLVSSLVIAIIFKLLAFRNLGWLGMFLTPIMVGVVSQIGDLCESFFKRAYKIKDSGKTLPGHGGFLDRFDGVLFSLPVMYLCEKIFS